MKAHQDPRGILLEWYPVVGAALYEIRRGNRWHHGEVVGHTVSTTFLVTDPRRGTETYWVRARNADGIGSPDAASASFNFDAPENYTHSTAVEELWSLYFGTAVNMTETGDYSALRLDAGEYAGSYTAAELDAGSVKLWYWSFAWGSLVEDTATPAADVAFGAKSGEALYRDAYGREASRDDNGADFDLTTSNADDPGLNNHGQPGSIYPKVRYVAEARFDTDGLGSWTSYRRFSAGYVKAQKIQTRITVDRVSLDYQCDIEYMRAAAATP